MKATRGFCRGCGELHKLDGKGRLKSHGIPGNRAAECQGSKRDPASQGYNAPNITIPEGIIK